MIYLALVLIIVLLPLAYSGFSMAPWVPSRKRDTKRINELAKLKAGEVFYELGCGDGRVCSYIAQKNPQAKVIGLELAYTMYFWAKIRSFFLSKKNLSIRLKNVFHADLSNADVIYVYGMPDPLKNELQKKFKKELKKGCRIISYVFSINGWQHKIKDKPAKNEAGIYLYEK